MNLPERELQLGSLHPSMKFCRQLGQSLVYGISSVKFILLLAEKLEGSSGKVTRNSKVENVE